MTTECFYVNITLSKDVKNMSNAKCKIVICDNVRQEMGPNGINNNIINILQYIEPINIPSNYTFVASCLFSDLDKDIEHNFSIKLIDPNQKLIVNFDNIKFVVPKSEQENLQAPLNLQINAEFRNVIISSVGNYAVQAYDNNEFISAETVEVKKEE